MFSLFKIFTLATAVVVIVDLLLVSRGEFSDQLAPQENTVVSLFSPSDDTTTEPSGFADAATRRGYATKVNTAYAPPRDNTAAEPSGFADAATRRGYATKVNTAYAPPRDNTTTEPSSLVDAATPPGHAFNVNIPSAPPTVPPPNFTVAFIGDQGSTSDALAVLALIKSEGADMVLHQGDLDYNDDPDAWDQRINDVLGPDFPYFVSIGNHDRHAWIGYQRKLADRLNRIPEADCTGDLGVKSSCRYQGLFFILSGVGTRGLDHESYIREELAQSDAIWRICSWHKNQKNMQIGGKGDATGWGVYEACREGGAIIATAHEHSYERTKTLISMQSQSIDPEWPHPQQVRVAPGASFVFVSGLGGNSVRDQERCLPSTPPYGCNGEWASIYSSNQGATHGALFCSFNFAGQPDQAHCYFKDIGSVVPDEFTITNFVAQAVQ